MKQAANSGAFDGVFGRILETLIAGNGREDADPARGSTYRNSRRSTPFWPSSDQENRKPARGAAKPSDFIEILRNPPAPEAETEPLSEAETEPLPEISAEAISAELGIREAHDLADLARIRKSFAVANHPDRNSGARRQWAEERMKLANSIIDAEIARRQAPRRRLFGT